MKQLFSSEGPIFTLINKVGQIIIINILWLIGCIPIVTVGTSTIAMYYSIVKTVRAEAGYPTREFFRSFKANLLKGIILTLIGGAAIVLLYMNRNIVSEYQNGSGLVLFILYDIAALFLGVMLLFCAPVISRFSVSFGRYVSLIFTMSIKYLHYSILMALVLAGVVIAICYYPLTGLFLPGIYCWLISFPVERVMRNFMPPKRDEDTEWYYDLRISFDRSGGDAEVEVQKADNKKE